MELSFSQRIGQTPIDIPIQVESINDSIRNAIWNLFYVDIFMKSIRYNDSYVELAIWIFRDYFNLPVDHVHSQDTLKDKVRTHILFEKWFKVYDFVEFISKVTFSKIASSPNSIPSDINMLLEKHSSGYRLIGNVLSPITNQSEITEISASIQKTLKFTSLKGCNQHLTSALAKLSDRENPDYRNSIKESISAVESIAKIISAEDSKSLKPALDKIKKPLGLHQALVTAFGSLYGYTSDEGGIRHAMMETNTSDFEDAKYMLVSCSAFINYLIAKCGKAGIQLS